LLLPQTLPAAFFIAIVGSSILLNMTKEEIDKKVKELADIDAKIQSSYLVNPVDLRKSDKLRSELYGHWDFMKGTYSKRVT